MKKIAALGTLLALTLSGASQPGADPLPAQGAQEGEPLVEARRPAAEPLPPRPAAGVEFFYSADSDDTEVSRAAIDLDISNRGQGRRLGVRVERAWYNPGGTGTTARNRVYLQTEDVLGDWQMRARVGTDGDSVIGSVSVNDNSRYRKEAFVERDIVETRQGLARGVYSTFAGAAVDVPIDDRNIVTALVGVQEFTGDNVRVHLRGNYVHVLRPDLGLSAQLRGRYFHSSVPGEYDYYSPRWYAEVLPVLQMRRFVGGWEALGAVGVGAQRDSESDWRSSRYAHARFRSPAAAGWSAHGAVTYTNTPSLTGSSRSGYSYVQFLLGASTRF